MFFLSWVTSVGKKGKKERGRRCDGGGPLVGRKERETEKEVGF